MSEPATVVLRGAEHVHRAELCKLGACIVCEVLRLRADLLRLTQERDGFQEQIAEAREACPAVRQQRFMDATLLEVVNEEISQLFRMQSRAEKAEAERDVLIGSIRGVVEDMQATIRAHRQWAMSPDATSAEAGMSTTLAGQIGAWVQKLLPPSSGGSA